MLLSLMLSFIHYCCHSVDISPTNIFLICSRNENHHRLKSVNRSLFLIQLTRCLSLSLLSSFNVFIKTVVLKWYPLLKDAAFRLCVRWFSRSNGSSKRKRDGKMWSFKAWKCGKTRINDRAQVIQAVSIAYELYLTTCNINFPK